VLLRTESLLAGPALLHLEAAIETDDAVAALHAEADGPLERKGSMSTSLLSSGTSPG
jgi:hypothetical protein